jgi:hypothetical protein
MGCGGMGSLKPREERRKTVLRARLRTDRGWSDVTIGNVSSRGLLIQCPSPLPRNSFIEVRHRNQCIVGRIVWTHGAKCGVRTQDIVDISGLLSQAPQKRRAPGEERRAAPRDQRRARPRAPEETAAASRRFARAFDWTIMVVAAGAAGAFMAEAAWAALGAPLAQVTTALSGAG